MVTDPQQPTRTIFWPWPWSLAARPRLHGVADVRLPMAMRGALVRSRHASLTPTAGLAVCSKRSCIHAAAGWHILRTSDRHERSLQTVTRGTRGRGTSVHECARVPATTAELAHRDESERQKATTAGIAAGSQSPW